MEPNQDSGGGGPQTASSEAKGYLTFGNSAVSFGGGSGDSTTVLIVLGGLGVVALLGLVIALIRSK